MTLNIVIFGLTITSSWGNGHAVTYRALIKALAERGHGVTFLERDVPWYREHRDLAEADYCEIHLYDHLKDVPARFGELVGQADLVVIGSYVPDGVALADWITTRARGVTAFYDIDTPVTLKGLADGKTDYLTAALIPRFDLYLTFTGGPVLDTLEQNYGARRARPLYCTADPDLYAPQDEPARWLLGYLGTYSPDRQPGLSRLMIEPAQQLKAERFVVAGPQYPAGIAWPDNIERIEHLAPADHPSFYARQRFALNITRADMVAAGHSPSVRLFEAAACGVPVISDKWPGIEGLFTPDKEILLAASPREVIAILTEMPEERRRSIAAAARRRFLQNHAPAKRAQLLESYIREATEHDGLRTAAEATA